jgi:DNA-binding MarR family transcriptional regulator
MLEGMPPVMWFIRRHMRRHRTRSLSVPQYRVLVLLDAQPNASLSAVADNMGLGLSATSRLVTGLVAKGFVSRCVCPSNRRQVSLELTQKGRAAMNANREDTLQRLAKEISHLTDEQRAMVVESMRLLKEVFGPTGAAEAARAAGLAGKPSVSSISSVSSVSSLSSSGN